MCICTYVAPLRLPVGMSPLVVVQRVPTMGTSLHKSSNFATPSAARSGSRVPIRAPLRDRVVQDKVVQDVGKEIGQDVASPEAARARANAVQTPANLSIRTPASVLSRRRNPSIPLHRAVLLSTGELE